MIESTKRKMQMSIIDSLRNQGTPKKANLTGDMSEEMEGEDMEDPNNLLQVKMLSGLRESTPKKVRLRKKKVISSVDSEDGQGSY